MDKKEKIRKIYQKYDIEIGDDIIEETIQDKERTKSFMRLYKNEEIDSMNYILGKPHSNMYFTEFELEAMNKIDLFDRNMINICKIIWDNRNDPEKLEKFMKELREEIINGKL